ncbi:MAG: hypothetical protein JWR50_4050 [Mucilaginibacter sp.]|nr:hypothetical protein [Mucilaginibacter sp.]
MKTNPLTYGEITISTLTNDAGAFIGLLLGTYISHTIFKNKGWHSSQKSDKKPPLSY